MSSGQRKDPKDDDKLLTSEDIFGDMLDEKPARPPAPPPAAAPAPSARRSGPIKVQVSEPGTPAMAPPSGPPPAKALSAKAPATKSPLIGPAAEELPDDVAALLDAFSRPGDAAAPEEGSPVELPDASALSSDLLELIPMEAEAAHPPEAMNPPAPPSPPPAALATDEEARHDLQRLRAPLSPATRGSAPAPGPPPKAAAELPVPQSRMGTKFRATQARVSAPEGKTVDLAALADEAFGEAPPSPVAPTPSAAPAAPAPARHEEAAAPTAQPVRSGEGAYGPYRLLERVALGGMAEVFKAKRSGVEGFEKVVAVKRILPHLSDNKEFVDMFVDEAKMVAGLTHPNIVQIFDLGRIEKSYYIAMEYVQGRDLRSILRRARERGTRMPLELCALVASRVCSALEYAHRKKDDRGQPMMTVHRDISPQNILISFEGDVKLTDFGIAKAASKATVTEVGALRGKLLYMSPEQAWGKPMDRRSDLFSLGIVFYEMITDQKPFLGNSEVSILETVRECKVAPPSRLNRAIPPSLERVVMKALERDPERRYQDAAEMYRDLEAVMHETQPPPTAAALARLMEQLYEPHEREDAVTEATPAEPPAAAGGARAEPEPAPAPPPAATGPSASMSIQKLLKRFGIK
jgi:serine/threonine protein kinase